MNAITPGGIDELNVAVTNCKEILLRKFGSSDANDHEERAAWLNAVARYKKFMSEIYGEDTPIWIEISPRKVECVSNFTEWRFPLNLKITDTKFESQVSFTNCIFSGRLDLVQCEFVQEIGFESCTFHEQVEISSIAKSSINFGGAKTLSSVKISSNSGFSIYFGDAVADGELTVTGLSRFDANHNSKFQGKVSLNSDNLRKIQCISTSFSELEIESKSGSMSEINLLNSSFSGIVIISACNAAKFNIDSARFDDYVCIKLNCSDDIDIDADTKSRKFFTANAAIFKSSLNFMGSKFFGSTSFNNAVFKGDVSFDGVEFKDYVSFEGTIAERPVNFTRAKFSQLPNFLDARFSYPISFNRIWKERKVPDGLVRSLPEDTLQGGESISDLFDALGKIASQGNDLWWQQEFVARSIQSARASKNLWQNTIGLLYEITSDFGRSVLRPLGWLVFIGFAVFLVVLYNMPFTSEYATIEKACAQTFWDRTLECFLLTFRTGFVLTDNDRSSLELLVRCTTGKSVSSASIFPVSFLLYTQKAISAVLWLLFGMGVRFMLRMR